MTSNTHPALEPVTRVVHFFHDMCPHMAGSYSTLKHFLAALPGPRYASHVVSFDRVAIAGAAGAPSCTRVVSRQDAASRYYRYASRSALDGVREQCKTADILFVHLLYRHHAVVAAEMAEEFDKPLVVVPHGSLDPYCFSYRGVVKKIWLQRYKKRLTRRTTFLFATDQEAVKAAVATGPVDSRVISWPCNLTDGLNLPHLPPQTHAPLKLLFVGRLHPMKRVLETIRAMHSVPEAACALRLVGEPDAPITRESVLGAAGHRLGRSIFYDGGSYGAQLLERYLESDALVLFSHRENFGNVVAEAMACGKPVFLSEGVDLAPLVARHGCGMVFQIRNERDIAGALSTIERLPRSEMEAMGRRAKTVAGQEFSFAKFSQRLGDLTEGLIRPAFSQAS